MGGALRRAARCAARRRRMTRDASTSRSSSPRCNGGADLPRLLDAIAAQEGPFRPSVVAVDSGSTDGTLDLLRAHGARILTVAPGEFNHGETRNLALRCRRHRLRGADRAGRGTRVTHGGSTRSSARSSPTRPWPGRGRASSPRGGEPDDRATTLSQWIGAASAAATVGPLTPAEFAALHTARAASRLRLRQRLLVHPDVGVARATRFRVPLRRGHRVGCDVLLRRPPTGVRARGCRACIRTSGPSRTSCGGPTSAHQRLQRFSVCPRFQASVPWCGR